MRTNAQQMLARKHVQVYSKFNIFEEFRVPGQREWFYISFCCYHFFSLLIWYLRSFFFCIYFCLCFLYYSFLFLLPYICLSVFFFCFHFGVLVVKRSRTRKKKKKKWNKCEENAMHSMHLKRLYSACQLIFSLMFVLCIFY